MKLLKQLFIITFFSLLGNVIANYLPFSIPGSVIGLVLLFLALEFKLIQLEAIKETSAFLVANMAFFFVPLTVGLMNDWSLIQNNLFHLILILIITTTITMAVVSVVSERLEK